MTTYFLRTVAIDQPPDLATTDQLARSVGNTGNMLFETALAVQLAPEVRTIWRLDDIPHDAERVVLSMSNFISEYTDMGKFAQALEEKRVAEVVMIGCGAQAHGYDSTISLKPGTRRFLDILSERSTAIGVRGEFTANALDALGYDRIRIVGCPSAFWPMDAGWEPFRQPREGLRLSCGIACTPTGKYRDKIRALLSYAKRHEMTYLCQNELNFIRPWTEGADGKPVLDQALRYYMKDIPAAKEMAEYLSANTKIFFNLSDWVSHVGSLDFVLGSRFHGNIVAMLAGRPNLHMVFDSRTRELVEFLNLPYIHLDHFDETAPVEAYLGEADFSGFRAAYPVRLANYMRYLKENGVPNRIGKAYFDRVPPEAPGGINARTVASLVDAAVQSAMPIGVFEKDLERRLNLGRTQEARDTAEIS